MIFGKNKNMNPQSMQSFEMDKFYHRLRLIFTYYASHGYKQDPLYMREKSFRNFLNDSTIAEILKTHQLKNQTQKSSIKNKGHQDNKNLLFYLNTYHKPMNYEKFKNLISKLLFQARYQKQQDEQFEQNQVQKDLFKLYQSDQIIQGVFSFLYEEIQQGTQFGSLITFSQNKAFFNKEVWEQVKIHRSLLRKIYSHYFSDIIPKEHDQVQEIMNVLKRFCLDFEIAPLKVSMTEVFIIVWQIVNCKSVSVYEQDLNEKDKSQVSIRSQRWDIFPENSFVKMILLIANLVQKKESKTDNNQDNKYEYGSQTIRNLLEYMGTTKGFKNIKSIYKINRSFYTVDKEKLLFSPLSKSIKLQERTQIDKKLLHFEPKSIVTVKQRQILQSFEKFLQLIFKHYTQHKKPQLMSRKQVDQFCSQFKLVPHLISKRQIGQIYHKLISQRNYFYLLTGQNNRSQPKRIPEENKLKIHELTSKPQFGLKFQQINKFLVYSAQLNKVNSQLTPVERLIYWIEYMFSQDKTKGLIQKSRTRQKFFVEKEINLISIYQKPKSIHSEHNFHAQHQSMFKKVKKSLK